MATIYVGPTSAGLADGTSWANRYGSLNAAEDRPIQAGDWVWVGPGVYREMLTCDVSGAAGNVITYAGDYDGSHTDGVGGVVRITGSDNDMTATRNYAVVGNYTDYRNFSGFVVDTTISHCVYLDSGPGAGAGICQNWTIERCVLIGGAGNSCLAIVNDPATASDNAVTVRNSAFLGGIQGIAFTNTNSLTSTNFVENCLFMGQSRAAGVAHGIAINRIGGGTVRNCLFLYCAATGFRINIALPVGYTPWTINNCSFVSCEFGVYATALGEIIEDYNNIFGCTTARTNVAVGAHSTAYPPLFDSRWFFEMVGGGSMVTPFDLSSWSQLINVAGTSPTATDMRGTAAIGGVREWGPLEYDTTLEIEGGGGAVSISPWRGGMIG